MSKGDLPFTVFGRPVKPLAMALMVSTFTIFYSNVVVNNDVAGGAYVGDIVGWTAGLTSLLLLLGWVHRSQRIAELGLLLATGVWVSRMAVVAMTEGVGYFGVWLSLGWVLAAGGAYLLEAWDDKTAQLKKQEPHIWDYWRSGRRNALNKDGLVE
jgi:hypothetical protein